MMNTPQQTSLHSSSPGSDPSPTSSRALSEQVALSSFLLLPTVSALLYFSHRSALLVPHILYALALAVLAFILTVLLIPRTTHLFIRADLFGRDINKRGTPRGDVKVPEALGLIPATIYVVVLCVLHMRGSVVVGVDPEVEVRAEALYTAALASVTFMTMLGFADDVLDLKWRYKMVLPLFGAMPLLANYAGSTSILVPRQLQSLLGWSSRLIDLGVLYKIYMTALSIFGTNAINILAGINGLEAGQSLIIGCFIAAYNAIRLNPYWEVDNIAQVQQQNLFSIDLILPFIGVTLGLLHFNWYPSAVFVGDTFCYFAGMTFAMAAILGNFSKMLLLFFIPQIINFVYSVPQLVGIVFCPRHRLPKYNVETGKLEPIKTNLNLVNLTLLITGPLTEWQLCVVLLVFQVVCCSFGLALEFILLR